jgi:hypothetical protein
MKLSEAIRLGALLRRQGFGNYFDVVPGAEGSCAMGAALEACGYDREQVALRGRPTELLESLWPWAGAHETTCPIACERWAQDYGMRTDAVRAVIAHLNDHHRWTRERIADWVATVEPADPEVATSLDGDSHHESVDAVDPVDGLGEFVSGPTRARVSASSCSWPSPSVHTPSTLH